MQSWRPDSIVDNVLGDEFALVYHHFEVGKFVDRFVSIG